MRALLAASVALWCGAAWGQASGPAIPYVNLGPNGFPFVGQYLGTTTAYFTVNTPSGSSAAIPFGVANNGSTKFYVDNYGNAQALNQTVGALGAVSAGCAYSPSSAMLGYNCFSSDHDASIIVYPAAPVDIDEAGTVVAFFSSAGLLTVPGINNTGTARSPIATYTAAFTFGAGMDAAEVSNASTTAYAATLPTCNAAIKGVGYQIVKTDANTNAITLTASGTDTISGSATVAVNAQWTAVQVKCDGAGFWLRGLH